MTTERNINRPIDTDAALDQLLAMAQPVPASVRLGSSIFETIKDVPADLPPASPHLKAGILAATVGTPQHDTQHSTKIIDFEARKSNPALFQPGQWATGGLMAASVILGIWLGNVGIADTYLRPTLSVVGLAQPDDDQVFTSDDYLGLTATDTNAEVM